MTPAGNESELTVDDAVIEPMMTRDASAPDAREAGEPFRAAYPFFGMPNRRFDKHDHAFRGMQIGLVLFLPAL